ncbi:transcription elongation factor [Anaeromyxobacter terrae]|uniref:transcription elongation factor n=1 Tax=Anaeromyxobacter terrae TaxID=2925406 RepID=UPI001F596FA0|nr:transcription elongation factor [Anaeromyxobacter sp. SG22]
MPSKSTTQKAKADLRAGKRPSTAAGEFVREEMEHIREGKHGARSSKQAIAIGLSKARRAGVPLSAPKKGATSARTRRSAKRDSEVGQGKRKPRAPSRRRSAAAKGALKREGRGAASKRSLSVQAKGAAARRRGSSSKGRKKAPRRTRAGGRGPRRAGRR